MTARLRLAAPGGMVGRVLDSLDLPGGAALIAKAARKAGGWYVWATASETTKAVKTINAKDAPNGVAVYRHDPATLVRIKGRHADGRRFVVCYLDGGIESAYVATHDHEATAPGQVILDETGRKVEVPGSTVRWRSERATFDAVTVTRVKAYITEQKEQQA